MSDMQKAAALQEIRAACADNKGDVAQAFPFSHAFLFWQQYVGFFSRAISNWAFISVLVFLATSCFLSSARLGLLLVAAIALIDLNMVALMRLEGMHISDSTCQLLLFALGIVSIMTRRNLVWLLIGIELILNAASLNFVAFSRYIVAAPTAPQATGLVASVIIIILAAAEAAVALAILLAIYRNFRSIQTDDLQELRN